MTRTVAALVAAVVLMPVAKAQEAQTPPAKSEARAAQAAKPKKQELALPDEQQARQQGHTVTRTLTAKNPPQAPGEAPPEEQAEAKPEEQPDPQTELLRKQVEQQAQLISLLQQQLANQEQQNERLQVMNQQLQTLQQQLAASQEQAAEHVAAQQQTVANLDGLISGLRTADQALLEGDASVDLTEISQNMPGEARSYLGQAQQSLNNGDLYTARSFLELAINIAEQSRVQATGQVPAR